MNEDLGDTGLETLYQVDVVAHPAGRWHILTRRKYGVGYRFTRQHLADPRLKKFLVAGEADRQLVRTSHFDKDGKQFWRCVERMHVRIEMRGLQSHRDGTVDLC